MTPEGLLNPWDYGIAIGVIIIFAYFTWMNLKASSKREERLLSSNEKFAEVINEHSKSLKRHNEILEKQAEVIQQQSHIVANISRQVDSVSDVIRQLKFEVNTLKQNMKGGND